MSRPAVATTALTPADPGPTTTPPLNDESWLVTRLLDTLLREDVAQLRSRGRVWAERDGAWLLRARPDASTLSVPVRAERYLCDWAARAPYAVVDGQPLTRCREILAALGPLVDDEIRIGLAAFAVECDEARVAADLQNRTRSQVDRVLTERHGPDPGQWRGPWASVAFDTLAARCDHPVHPTSRGRAGFDEFRTRSYAPECHPRFRLRLLALPRESVEIHGDPTWPLVDGLGEDEIALPVHPLAVGDPLRAALEEAGLTSRARLLEAPGPEVTPTLSLRTVASVEDPRLHLKVPLATATLGARNKRTITPGSLVDGAAGQRLLERIATLEPTHPVLHADEQDHAHARHPMLACLWRRQPRGLEGAVTLPLAALTAAAPSGRLVVDHLADRFTGGDPVRLLTDVWDTLLGWQTTLFSYGIALESHQQNVSLVLDEPGGHTRMRLLFKDDDSLRLHVPRLTDRLGAGAADGFDDARILTEDDRSLTDMFTTITLHLCCAAPALALERAGRIAPGESLPLLRDHLGATVDAMTDTAAAATLRRHVLEAPSLPVKAMVTAGTLASKERTGARDINKHYVPGPTYLAGQA